MAGRRQGSVPEHIRWSKKNDNMFVLLFFTGSGNHRRKALRTNKLVVFRKILCFVYNRIKICRREVRKRRRMAAEGVSLNHISRESLDVKRLAQFYKELFGFEEMESPEFGEFKVVWLRLPSSTLCLHLIERNPSNNLPEGPWSATSSIADPSHLPRGHHLCFSVSNFQSFLHTLKDKGITTYEKSLPNGNIKQVFFFDPDGNGLEVASKEDS